MNLSSMLNEPLHMRKVLANGWHYYEWSRAAYPYPCDEREQDRLVYLNIMLYYKVDSPAWLHHATLPRVNGKVRVLDVLCGGGWWAQRLAELNPAYEVVGIDIVGHQPAVGYNREPNVDFIVPVDCMSDNWGVRPASFQLIHVGLAVGRVADYPAFYRNIFRHVAPGGHVELAEIDWRPRYDVEDPKPYEDAAALHEWWTNMREATRQHGHPIEYRQDTGELLEQAGFTDIRHIERRVQLFVPQWLDVVVHETSRDFRLAMGDADAKPWSGMSMELFTRFRGYNPGLVDHLDAKLVAAMNRSGSPFYFNVHIWTARKPGTQRPMTQAR
ncbi:hypothetical protein LTR36_007284 [Oleoguttula mirabilis]|uniref:S-adenosyl-L-methionine-dependent methyltransferase n=1 Tax=Oleoguttula mirabilis TaxID=1507867 RepID=A0AAV9JAP1_9PEZI|nr:hypothetical protein LTR36_007284 [Oleoguttula mirabilis]